jgi:hypothetical protein
MTKSRRTTGKAHVAHKAQTINIHNILAVKYLGVTSDTLSVRTVTWLSSLRIKVQGNPFLNCVRCVKVPLKQLRNY